MSIRTSPYGLHRNSSLQLLGLRCAPLDLHRLRLALRGSPSLCLPECFLRHSRERPPWTSRHLRRAGIRRRPRGRFPPLALARGLPLLRDRDLSWRFVRLKCTLLPTIRSRPGRDLRSLGELQGHATTTCCMSAAVHVVSHHLDGSGTASGPGILQPSRTGFASFRIRSVLSDRAVNVLPDLRHTRVCGVADEDRRVFGPVTRSADEST
jgi:hypothetical protein